MAASKIVTCCYCGSREVLVLRGVTRHELSCGSCGAPLRALKMLPITTDRATAPAAAPARPEPKKQKRRHHRHRGGRPEKYRKTKSLRRKIWSKFWDAVDDIFD